MTAASQRNFSQAPQHQQKNAYAISEGIQDPRVFDTIRQMLDHCQRRPMDAPFKATGVIIDTRNDIEKQVRDFFPAKIDITPVIDRIVFVCGQRAQDTGQPVQMLSFDHLKRIQPQDAVAANQDVFMEVFPDRRMKISAFQTMQEELKMIGAGGGSADASNLVAYLRQHEVEGFGLFVKSVDVSNERAMDLMKTTPIGQALGASPAAVTSALETYAQGGAPAEKLQNVIQQIIDVKTIRAELLNHNATATAAALAVKTEALASDLNALQAQAPIQAAIADTIQTVRTDLAAHQVEMVVNALASQIDTPVPQAAVEAPQIPVQASAPESQPSAQPSAAQPQSAAPAEPAPAISAPQMPAQAPAPAQHETVQFQSPAPAQPAPTASAPEQPAPAVSAPQMPAQAPAPAPSVQTAFAPQIPVQTPAPARFRSTAPAQPAPIASTPQPPVSAPAPAPAKHVPTQFQSAAPAQPAPTASTPQNQPSVHFASQTPTPAPTGATTPAPAFTPAPAQQGFTSSQNSAPAQPAQTAFVSQAPAQAPVSESIPASAQAIARLTQTESLSQAAPSSLPPQIIEAVRSIKKAAEDLGIAVRDAAALALTNRAPKEMADAVQKMTRVMADPSFVPAINTILPPAVASQIQTIVTQPTLQSAAQSPVQISEIAKIVRGVVKDIPNALPIAKELTAMISLQAANDNPQAILQAPMLEKIQLNLQALTLSENTPPQALPKLEVAIAQIEALTTQVRADGTVVKRKSAWDYDITPDAHPEHEHHHDRRRKAKDEPIQWNWDSQEPQQKTTQWKPAVMEETNWKPAQNDTFNKSPIIKPMEETPVMKEEKKPTASGKGGKCANCFAQACANCGAGVMSAMYAGTGLKPPTPIMA